MKIRNKNSKDEIMGVDTEIVRQITQDGRLTFEDIGVYMTFRNFLIKKQTVTIDDLYENTVLDSKKTVDVSISRLCSFGYIKLAGKKIIDLRSNN